MGMPAQRRRTGCFEGTVLAVMHDRYFIQGFASRIWDVEGGWVQEYLELEDAKVRGGA
jgi:ATPase subunit of ABC transporter with duplicated ATPase domains